MDEQQGPIAFHVLAAADLESTGGVDFTYQFFLPVRIRSEYPWGWLGDEYEPAVAGPSRTLDWYLVLKFRGVVQFGKACAGTPEALAGLLRQAHAQVESPFSLLIRLEYLSHLEAAARLAGLAMQVHWPPAPIRTSGNRPLRMSNV